MRHTVLLGVLTLMVAACGNVLENIEITIDGEQIFADTCQDLADSIAETVDERLQNAAAENDADLPDIDVEGLIDRADDLGCSPDELRGLVDDALGNVGAVTESARGFLDGLREEFSDKPS